MRIHFLLPLFLWGACFCFCARSQVLHQCSTQGGTTAYRSGACLPGERQVAVREMEVESTPPSAQDAGPAAAKSQANKARRSTRARARHRKSTVDPCTREKRARDGFQHRRGIKITMVELSRWNHRVYDACK